MKFELGYPLVTSAQAYIGITAIFEIVIATYLADGVATTSTTAVTAATTATPIALTLASATGFATGSRVWVDVDDRMESGTIQNLSGSIATLLLSKVHSGTYKVALDNGESIVREILDQIRKTKLELAQTFGEGALKKVDEIEFYQTGSALFGSTAKVLAYWRTELASALGIPNMWDQKSAAGGRIAMY